MTSDVQAVDPDDIENIVGISRQTLRHMARAVSSEQRVYILHSMICFNAGTTLTCGYSQALGNGIDPDAWVEDQTIHVIVQDGQLVPCNFCSLS